MTDKSNPTISTMSRREAFVGAGAMTLAAVTSLPTGARAAAPMQGAGGPVFNRFKMGDFEVTTILDGAIALDGPHPIFGQNAEAADVQNLAEQNFLPPTRMEIGFTQTVVNTGSELVLFDAGNGAGRRPAAGQLLARLAAAGIKPEDVDIVALTHFHPDHIGGLAEDGAPAFPNARYVIGEAEYNFWSPPEMAENEKTARIGKLVQSNVVPIAEKATFVKAGGAVVSGIEAVDTSGHTPGHTAFHVESADKRLMITGDLCNHYVVSMQRPDWHVRFDMDKEKAVAARKQTLGMIAADRIPMIGYHMPFPASGYVEAMGDGFRWVPTTYQFNV